jgi:hypothetical protein
VIEEKLVRYIERETSEQERVMNGRALSIMNRLPSLSIYKTAIPLPTAFIRARGKFRIIKNLS